MKKKLLIKRGGIRWQKKVPKIAIDTRKENVPSFVHEELCGMCFRECTPLTGLKDPINGILVLYNKLNYLPAASFENDSTSEIFPRSF